jgi:parvulin-like peptidyl-prolyl isomerase
MPLRSLLFLHLALCTAGLYAAEPAAISPETVIATVGDGPVQSREAERLLARVTRGKKIAPEALPYARAQVLEEIVARRLVVAYAERAGEAPGPAQIEKARAKLKSQLSGQRKSIPAFLEAEAMTEADLDRELAWNALWDKYLEKYLTQQRLAAWFEAHRQELDGTELVVSHILLRTSPGQSSEEVVKRAETVRRDILAGKVSFAEAAQKHSEGPSRSEGGRLGVIGRHGPMDEAFSRAAFALKAQQISPPTKTSFGVHLIRCDEVKPGRKQLDDVRKEVEAALGRELLDKLAAIQRRTTAVKYTAKWPHFRPGTRELAGP